MCCFMILLITFLNISVPLSVKVLDSLTLTLNLTLTLPLSVEVLDYILLLYVYALEANLPLFIKSSLLSCHDV